MSAPTIGLVLAVDVLDENNAVFPAVQNFIDIYEDAVERIVIIGPSRTTISHESVKVITVPRSPPINTLSRILSYIWYQVRIAYKIFASRSKLDSIFFHTGGTALLLPLLVCRAINMPSNVFVLGSATSCYYGQHGRDIVSTSIVGFLTALEWAASQLASRILVLSEGLKSPAGDGFFSPKRFVGNLNYIDGEYFEGNYSSQENVYDLVYVGRFEGVKGITNLAYALAHVVERHPNLRVCLIGDGSLRGKVERILQNQDASDQVNFVGWINHDQVPFYLGKSRMLVLPSESEGVPKTILEAMACRTVPIATPVGGVPDIIDDGKTGILIPDNDPRTIADTISQTLERDDLDEIASRAQAYIRDTHSYEATSQRFLKLLPTECEMEN